MTAKGGQVAPEGYGDLQAGKRGRYLGPRLPRHQLGLSCGSLWGEV
jgi:hypothetical protein